MIAKVLGYQGIPTTRTVREAIASDCPECGGTGAEGYVIRYWDAHSWVEPCSSCAAGQVVAYTRERTVMDPIYVVPQMLPCPESGCENGSFWWGKYDYDGNRIEFYACVRCDGLGVVAPPWPDYIATDEVRHHKLGRWWDWHTIETDGEWTCADEGWETEFNATERRQVVAYKVTAIDELPVVDDDILDEDAPRRNMVRLHSHGVCMNADFDRPTIVRNVTDEPWAADLTPGGVVWRLHLEALDQPYTEALQPTTDVYFSTASKPGLNPAKRRVPLSVPVGEVAEIELADPKENTDG